MNGDLLALRSEVAPHLSKFGDNSPFVGAPRKSTLKSDLVIRSMIKTPLPLTHELAHRETDTQVQSCMQILSEIYGYLFEIVKRTCVALSDPSIYAEICTLLERIEQSGPSLLCLYSLSELT